MKIWQKIKRPTKKNTEKRKNILQQIVLHIEVSSEQTKSSTQMFVFPYFILMNPKHGVFHTQEKTSHCIHPLNGSIYWEII